MMTPQRRAGISYIQVSTVLVHPYQPQIQQIQSALHVILFQLALEVHQVGHFSSLQPGEGE